MLQSSVSIAAGETVIPAEVDARSLLPPIRLPPDAEVGSEGALPVPLGNLTLPFYQELPP
jgi:hypothetical protein